MGCWLQFASKNYKTCCCDWNGSIRHIRLWARTHSKMSALRPDLKCLRNILAVSFRQMRLWDLSNENDSNKFSPKCLVCGRILNTYVKLIWLLNAQTSDMDSQFQTIVSKKSIDLRLWVQLVTDQTFSTLKTQTSLTGECLNGHGIMPRN